jgi:hypothetical protein
MGCIISLPWAACWREDLNTALESQDDPSQAYSGIGCRPTRTWVFAELRKLLDFVFVPATQPWHEEFPTNWGNEKEHTAPLQRAIFIASRQPIESSVLIGTLISHQTLHL